MHFFYKKYILFLCNPFVYELNFVNACLILFVFWWILRARSPGFFVRHIRLSVRPANTIHFFKERIYLRYLNMQKFLVLFLFVFQCLGKKRILRIKFILNKSVFYPVSIGLEQKLRFDLGRLVNFHVLFCLKSIYFVSKLHFKLWSICRKIIVYFECHLVYLLVYFKCVLAVSFSCYRLIFDLNRITFHLVLRSIICFYAWRLKWLLFHFVN